MVVAVGGFDPTGGAGVVRDLLTGRTLGARVRLVPTAWTAQAAATGVGAIEPRDPTALGEAVSAALGAATALGPVAVKVGMMPNATAAASVLAALRTFAGPVVVDPVLGASSGGDLYRGDLRDLLGLVARATVATPNAVEAARLTGQAISDLDGAARAGKSLLEAGARAVLIKGGHLEGAMAVDILVTPDGARHFSAERLPGPSVRGTGCALATAIAVGLARGRALADAVAEAKAWLHEAIQRAVAVGDEWHLD